MVTRKVLMVGVVAGSVGLGGLIGALVFAPGVGVAVSDTQGIRELGICIGADGPLDSAAEAIGIDTSQLASALRDGETIADVARAHDVPVSDVVDAVVAPMQARLDAAVEDGSLTRDRADALSANLRERATGLVNGDLGTLPGWRGIALPGPWVRSDGPLAVAAEAIGIDVSELASALREGDTIADVARAHDVPPSDVVDAVVAPMQARLAAAVEDGSLTREQADAWSAGLRERVTDFVNGTPAVFPREPGAGPPAFGSSELSNF